GLSRHELHPEPRWLGWLRVHQARAIGRLAHIPGTLLLVLAVALLGAGIALSRTRSEVLPLFREGPFVLQVASLPGTSTEEMRRIGARISADVLALPEIATVEQQIGRAEAGEDTWGPERCEFHIELKRDPHIDQLAVQDKLRDILDGYPGLRSEVMTF